jgi:TadE-like protein
MARIMDKIPYLNKRIANRRSKAQGLIEFAFISLILFLLLFGILEMGRLMFIFSQISSAAQEGTRYGSTHPLEIISQAADGLNTYPAIAHSDDPCNIVAQARARVVLLNPNDVGVVVGYDTGDSAPYYPISGGSANFIPARDRVVVTTTYQFHFVVGILDTILPANGLTVQMVSARTITNNETSVPPAGSCGYDPGAGYTPVPPGPTATPAPPTPTATSVAAAPTNTPLASPTPCPPYNVTATSLQNSSGNTHWVGFRVTVTRAGSPVVPASVTAFINGTLVQASNPSQGVYTYCDTNLGWPPNSSLWVQITDSCGNLYNYNPNPIPQVNGNPSCP